MYFIPFAKTDIALQLYLLCGDRMDSSAIFLRKMTYLGDQWQQSLLSAFTNQLQADITI